MSGDPAPHFLDRPAARVAAVLCFLLAAAGLAYMHREDLLGAPAEAGKPEAGLFAACMAERGAAIDAMVREGAVKGEQEALFRSRAEAMCRGITSETAGAGARLPPPPGLTPPPLPTR
jgi:hypothetical protein